MDASVDAEERDDLRDASRTELPILLCDAGTVPRNCERALGYERGRFHADCGICQAP